MEKIAYILPIASCIYLIISCWWVRQFFRPRGGTPGVAEGDAARGRGAAGGGAAGGAGSVPEERAAVGVGSAPRAEAASWASAFTPPVSLLKPVRGLDPGAYENFASFCRQDYPEFEVLFAVDTADDPAVPVIERVARDFPQLGVRLLVTSAQGVPNPKASCLAELTSAANHTIVAVSDSDMRVGPDYLRRVVAPLERPEVGLVTCAFRGVGPVTFTAKLEALYMGVTFLPQVVVARRFLEMRFALGGTMVMRVADLQSCGGWEAAGRYVAEDTRVAQQMAAIGKEVVLSDYIVDGFLGPTTWHEQWHREVRWARTNRGNRPREYPGLILTLTVPLALVVLPIDPSGAAGWGVVAIALAIRWLTAWLVTGYTANRPLRRWLAWLPLRDLLSALVWCAGAGGSTVVWRGRRLRVGRGGRLTGAWTDLRAPEGSPAPVPEATGGRGNGR